MIVSFRLLLGLLLCWQKCWKICLWLVVGIFGLLFFIFSMFFFSILRIMLLFCGVCVSVLFSRLLSNLLSSVGLFWIYIGLVFFSVSEVFCVQVSGVSVRFSFWVRVVRLICLVLFLVMVWVLFLMCVRESSWLVRWIRWLVFFVVVFRVECQVFGFCLCRFSFRCVLSVVSGVCNLWVVLVMNCDCCLNRLCRCWVKWFSDFISGCNLCWIFSIGNGCRLFGWCFFILWCR